jgi:hypothetical protein
MTDTQIIMFCTVVLAITACVIHNSTKTIAAMLYRRMVTGEIEPPTPPKPKPKSPYGVIHTVSSNKNWGYCVTKNGEIFRSSRSASAPVYTKITDAMAVINTYEKLEGYEVSDIGEQSE